jgi:hypothetical protein
VDLGRFEAGIHGSRDGDEVAVAAELIEKSAEVGEGRLSHGGESLSRYTLPLRGV